ncbi:SMI1/KNR4 family protein [Pseudomonas amygdali]|uniref:SMI1-like protein n=1 Tax=Pseudomonas amygdali pv. lachrymans TaxID=53707 RepID=A0ABR5KQH1_PSEAV|nr:SMI1/KNR4 family protein [Pseudomonas amygdali]KPC17043.1 SMI1-like protein [Pseudomonas amygdali pv. lachrymans]KPC18002.1 SMI1-like protein [Pseudomonas amygdali pv. lachrymans]RMT05831.1 SMI1 / KNR4 protein [Pseudomonas amygdali pv. lachrymans]
MNPELQSKLEALYLDHPSLRGTPATDQQILGAQERLGVTFHPDYIDFIKHYGGSFGGVDIHAFGNGSLLGTCTVIDLTLGFRELCDHFIPTGLEDAIAISDDGGGNPILISSRGQIYLYLHDEHKVELLASSLEALLEQSFPCA